jgi:hypothetical protein
MSGVAFNCVTPEVTVTGGNTDTVIGIAAAANHRVHIKKIKISFMELLAPSSRSIRQIMRL